MYYPYPAPEKPNPRIISPNTQAIQTTTDGGCYRTTGYTDGHGGLRRCTPEGKIIKRNRMSKKQRRLCRAKLKEMGVELP